MVVKWMRSGRVLLLASPLMLSLISCQTPALAPSVGTLVQPDRDGWVVSPGQKIPALELMDPSGSMRPLSEFLGKPVVLLFWGST